MRIRSNLLIGTVLVLFATPAVAQSNNEDFWKDKWFWGGQAGGFLYSAGGTQEAGVGVGGHWFITAGHSALNFAFDQLILTGSSVQLANGRQVDFSDAQRIQATVYATPSTGDLQLYLGGGFAIQHITDAAPVGTFNSQSELDATVDQIERLATKAFVVLGGGVQWRWFKRWVIFAQYQLLPSTDDFLITSAQHSIQGGLRIALTSANEMAATR